MRALTLISSLLGGIGLGLIASAAIMELSERMRRRRNRKCRYTGKNQGSC